METDIRGKTVIFREASLFESNSHLRALPPVHDTGRTRILTKDRKK